MTTPGAPLRRQADRRPAVTGGEIEYLIDLGGRRRARRRRSSSSPRCSSSPTSSSRRSWSRARDDRYREDLSFEEVMAIIGERAQPHRSTTTASTTSSACSTSRTSPASCRRGCRQRASTSRVPEAGVLRARADESPPAASSRSARSTWRSSWTSSADGLVTSRTSSRDRRDQDERWRRSWKALPDGRFLAAAPPPARRGGARHRVPEDGDYGYRRLPHRSLAGSATGSIVVWNGLTFTIRAADERHVSKVEIGRSKDSTAATGEAAGASPELKGAL